MERVATHHGDLLAEARAAGLTVRADGDRLVVNGPVSRKHLVDGLLAAKLTVLTALAQEFEGEIVWRVAQMTPQVPATGTIPVLVARPCAAGPADCLSCGDPKDAGQRYRCRACAEAARRVVAAIEAERLARRARDGGQQ